MTDNRCGAVAQIKVGAVVVTELRCGLDFGHGDFGIRHSVELEWTDEAVLTLPDADLLDPTETMDVVVEMPADGCSTCADPEAPPCLHDERFGRGRE